MAGISIERWSKIRVGSKNELWEVKNEVREENMMEEEDGDRSWDENGKWKYASNINENVTK